MATCEQIASGPSHDRSLLAVIRLSLLFAALVFSASPGKSQISPGPLAKAHQSLSGTSQCASCHQFGASTPTFKCLECHKEIARLLSENTGYHARLEMKNRRQEKLIRTHRELLQRRRGIGPLGQAMPLQRRTDRYSGDTPRTAVNQFWFP